MNSHWKILVVDDEIAMRESLAAWLREDGYTVDTAASGREALERARQTAYDIYFIDLKMPPGINGIETMIELRRFQPDATVVVVTAYATVDTAISAMKEGAQEYMVKPCNPEEVSAFVARVIKLKNLQRENLYLRKKLSRQYTFQDIISKSPRMHEIFELVRAITSQRSTVLIQGESGTGKELIARAIHHAGDRSARPFVGVSCAALAETLLESELFGHEKGSFTGAIARKRGKFEVAAGGSIFLDEIGDISPKLQMDLLRVLQERKFFRLGGTDEIAMEARVIAATNRNLQEAVEAGTFRDDLFYRLNVINIRIPPLRERREDIPLLVEHFIGRLAIETGKPVREVSRGALKLLMDHEWPGNVRELENALERAIVTAHGEVLEVDNFDFLASSPHRHQPWEVPGDVPLSELEQRAVMAALERSDGNIKAAAIALGVDRSTLYAKLKKYGVPRRN
ncbi:MAG: sigma-54 dependent transcriptional regulator [Candidatus Krumholzibacteriia bacterium]